MTAAALLAASARRRLPPLVLLAASAAAALAALGTFAAAAASPSFAELARYRVYVRRAFIGASGAMILFALVSGWYFCAHYLATRRRELALWLLAGSGRALVLRSLAIELGAAIGAALATGLAAAALLSRFFSLVLGALMRGGELPVLRVGALPVATCVACALLCYLASLLRASMELSRCSIAFLVRAEREPEARSPATGVRAACGAVLLAAGYAAAIFSRGLLAEYLILPALVAAVAGTFLAFDALLPFLADALRSRSRNRGAAAMFAAAQIAFRSRRNAKLLALAAVLLGMASSAVGTLISAAEHLWVEYGNGQESLVGALLFIGGFLAAAFAASAAALLASRAAQDAKEDRERMLALRELGAPGAVLVRAIALQAAFLFGLPLAFGLMHAAAALAMLKTFSGYSSLGPGAWAGGGTAALIALAAAASIRAQVASHLRRKDLR